MFIDLLLVAILIQLGATVLGLAAAFALWRYSARRANSGFIRTSVRTVMRVAAAVLLFALVAGYTRKIFDTENDNDEDESAEEVAEGSVNFESADLDLAAGDAIALTRLVLELRTTEDSAQAQRLADSTAHILRRAGARGSQLDGLREAAHEMLGSNDNAPAHAAIDRAFGVARPLAADTAALAYAAALQRGDRVAAETLRVELRNAVAGPELSNRDRTISGLQRQVRQLENEAERRERRGGVRAFVGGAADDLGLGFGWLALYFTASLALMGGQTPGKRALHIRVMRLDAKPVTWWIAFERFGGYAASATLGLLGFLQILWDRNRQGLHDKAVETVVIKTR